jgi:hypothetical protein
MEAQASSLIPKPLLELLDDHGELETLKQWIQNSNGQFSWVTPILEFLKQVLEFEKKMKSLSSLSKYVVSC